ncbi:MAG: GTPase domain-containing protein [Granulosicoccus sp.]|nr:GTPase domain-containing protein [Granulosicoccus sp.]
MNLSPVQWVPLLTKRYVEICSKKDVESSELHYSLNTLLLADATLSQSELLHKYQDIGSQIVVMGPTQSGKSTLVNILLGQIAARASPLAGFTVHAQGYAQNYPEADLEIIDSLMKPLERRPANTLEASDLEHYALENVADHPSALIRNAVVWDTPDFDSIASRSYSASVYKSAALADVIIMVVSKDKYGDKSVWDMLGLLHALAKPLLVCINKLDEPDRAVVNKAFVDRFTEQFKTTAPPLVLLPFKRTSTDAEIPDFSQSDLNELQQALHDIRAQSSRQEQTDACLQFIKDHEQGWLAPLIEERQYYTQWLMMVQQLSDDADNQYAQSYLNNPDKYDSFNRALAELLSLLEIPGIAKTLSRTRSLVTWPARRLLGVGRTALSRTPLSNDGTANTINQEGDVMAHIFDSAMVSAQSQLLEQPDTLWWKALSQNFREQQPDIRKRFVSCSEQTRAEFEPEIEIAAKALFEQLQAQPRLLNTLRAARVSADAAGVALAVKSGGLAPADLVLAPAMLSVTTLLTESALGRYLDTVKLDLMNRQRQHVMETLWISCMANELTSLADSLTEARLFSRDLEPDLQELLDSMIGEAGRHDTGRHEAGRHDNN